MVRRALAAAVPVPLSGVLQLTLGLTTASAAAPPAPHLGVMPRPRVLPETGSSVGIAGLALVIAGTGLAAASTARRRRRQTAG
jgi:LPXTG-motif cell wall-anchored protein